MTEDLPRRLRDLPPEKRALLERLLLQRAPTRSAPAAIPARDRSEPRRSPFQKRIWFLDQLNPGVPVYSRTWARGCGARSTPGPSKAR